MELKDFEGRLIARLDIILKLLASLDLLKINNPEKFHETEIKLISALNSIDDSLKVQIEKSKVSSSVLLGQKKNVRLALKALGEDRTPEAATFVSDAIKIGKDLVLASKK